MTYSRMGSSSGTSAGEGGNGRVAVRVGGAAASSPTMPPDAHASSGLRQIVESHPRLTGSKSPLHVSLSHHSWARPPQFLYTTLHFK